MTGDQDYSWMDGPAISPPPPYSVRRRRRMLWLGISLLSLAAAVAVICGALSTVF